MKHGCGSLLFVLGILSGFVEASGFDTAIDELARQITSEMSGNQRKAIAVVEFVDLKEGEATELGRFLSEELTTRLFRTRRFKVIERQLLAKVIAEHKLSLTDVVDEGAAMKLGQLLGVDAICSGTVAQVAGMTRINARLIATDTGEVFAVAASDVAAVVTETPRPTPAADQRIEQDGFEFEVKGCSRGGGVIACSIVVVSAEGTRRPFALYVRYGGRDDYRTSLLDVAGNEYYANRVTLGGQSAIVGAVSTDLEPGIPIRATASFDTVPSSTQSVTLMLVYQDVRSTKLTKAVFRGIQIAARAAR